MSNRSRSLFSAWMGVLLLAAASVSRCVEAADVEEVAKRVAAHLDAGEFAVAQQMIGGIADPAMRDAMMARMAQGQMRGGSRRGFANAMGGIGNDSMRSGLLSSGSGFAGASNGFGPPVSPMGGQVMADFEPLMELIRNTTGLPQPGWVDDGGVGTVREFPGGVYVDASGVLKRMHIQNGVGGLAAVRDAARAASDNRDVRKSAAMRKVSLTRLERAAQLKRALGQVPDESMQTLAGLQKIHYVLAYPETGDIVLVGPAGDWATDAEGRRVGVETGRPVLRLDDLVVLLRNAQEADARFGCSIDPRADNLAQTKSFLVESSKQPLKPGQRDAWLAKLRDLMGKQDIDVFGMDPQTRVARVLVEADYRMKLIGMGLEEGVLGVKSYLDSIQIGPNEAPPAMDVLRWWFTVNYDAIQATAAHDAFELKGQGVKVLSENQMLTERGQRVPTGQSDNLNAEFAGSFTKHFPQLAAKYPIYAELQNIFDLALVAGLLRAEDLPGQVGWQMSYFTNPALYQVELGAAPKEVDTIVNHRVIQRKHVVAGVSGGVSVDVQSLVQKGAVKTDDYGALNAARAGAAPKGQSLNAWWWD